MEMNLLQGGDRLSWLLTTVMDSAPVSAHYAHCLQQEMASMSIKQVQMSGQQELTA